MSQKIDKVSQKVKEISFTFLLSIKMESNKKKT
jgi:hypothetical protein